MDTPEDKPRSAFMRFIHRFFIGPLRFAATKVLLSLFAIAFVGRVTLWIVGPPAYKVYIVGDFQNSPKHVSIRKGFNPDRSLNKDIDGCKVEIEYVDDKGNLEEARRVAAMIRDEDDALLVVGHMRSTNTKQALGVYMLEEPPIPVILTAETNPDLAPAPELHDLDYPVVRLSASDKVQARNAVDFAVRSKARSFWVMEGAVNPVYAEYLAREFRNEVQRRQGEVLLLTSRLTLPPAEVLRKLNMDCLFFAGAWQDALVAVRQVRKLNGGILPRLVLLSDAAVEQDLIAQGGRDVEGVHLMHPARAAQAGGADITNLYELFGRDARLMVERLIDEADARFVERRRRLHPFDYLLKRVLALHRVADAREVLNEAIRSLPKLSRDQQGTEEFTYRSDSGLSNTNQRFHVWQVTQGRFTDVPEE